MTATAAEIQAIYRAAHRRVWGYDRPMRMIERRAPAPAPAPAPEPPARPEIVMRDWRPTVRSIVDAVAAEFRVSAAEIYDRPRHRSVVRARQLAMYLARVFTGKSLPEIGKHVGDRDHTTVLHALRVVEARIAGRIVVVGANMTLTETVRAYRLASEI